MLVNTNLEKGEVIDKNITKRVVSLDVEEAIEKARSSLSPNITPRKYIHGEGWMSLEPRRLTSIDILSCVNISPVDLV